MSILDYIRSLFSPAQPQQIAQSAIGARSPGAAPTYSGALGLFQPSRPPLATNPDPDYAVSSYSGALNLFQGGAQLTGGGPVVHDDHTVNAPSATAAQQPFQPVAYTNEVVSSFSGPAPTGLLTPQVGNRVYDPYSNMIKAPNDTGSFDPYAHLVSSSRGVFDVGYDIAPQGAQTR